MLESSVYTVEGKPSVIQPAGSGEGNDGGIEDDPLG